MAAKRPADTDPAGAKDAKRAKVTEATAPGPQALRMLDDHLWEIVNSPYGTGKVRSEKYGWGNVFKSITAVPANKLVHIGTSSLNPTPSGGGGKSREMKSLLGIYRKKFATLEHCATYHKIPEEKTWESWAKLFASGGKGFRVTIKAHKFLTHEALLAINDATREHLVGFIAKLRIIKDNLGCVLIQLPPHFRKTEQNLQRLRDLATILPDDIRFAFDFRSPTMFCDEVYTIMKEQNWATVVYHLLDESGGKDFTTPFADTCSDLVYIRLHGCLKVFCGDYGPAEMKKWAAFIAAATAAKKHVYVFFNNNESVLNKLCSSIADATCLAQEVDAVRAAEAAAGAVPAATSAPTPASGAAAAATSVPASAATPAASPTNGAAPAAAAAPLAAIPAASTTAATPAAAGSPGSAAKVKIPDIPVIDLDDDSD